MTSPAHTIGYCTNVHAGMDLEAIRDNLDRYAVPVRSAVAGDEDLGVGLWLPAQAAKDLSRGSAARDFAKFLRSRRLHAYTINAFPYDNFHQTVVKHRVYLPTWWQQERLDYTKQVADVLSMLLSEPGDEPGTESDAAAGNVGDSETLGSISTLPIGWPSEVQSDDQLERAGRNLRELADHLQLIESRTGHRIVVAIEPEPGCILDTTDGVIRWFEKHLPDSHHRRFLSVCHDICHAAVMMESQSEVLKRFAAAGITIGKVQVSSAVVADWQSMATGRRREALDQLGAFAEDRYLHQTGRLSESGDFSLAEDLPELIRSARVDDGSVEGDAKWVVHFHVPIFLERFGHLTTSHADVLECLRTLSEDQASHEAKIDFTGHLEIETYAWSVLPESMRRRGLAEDIAEEFHWLKRAMAESM